MKTRLIWLSCLRSLISRAQSDALWVSCTHYFSNFSLLGIFGFLFVVLEIESKALCLLSFCYQAVLSPVCVLVFL